MTPEQQASTSQRSRYRWVDFLVGLIIVAIIGLVVAAVTYGNEPRVDVQVPDTAETLMFDGWLWGDPEVSDGVATFTERLDRLPMNQPWPPYYDSADNETEVRVGDRLFEHCASNAQIIELPTTSVSCYEVTVGGMGDKDAKKFGKMKGLG